MDKVNGENWKPGDADDHAGAGGTYVIQDGKRVLVEGSRTVDKPVKTDPATGARTEIKDKE